MKGLGHEQQCSRERSKGAAVLGLAIYCAGTQEGVFCRAFCNCRPRVSLFMNLLGQHSVECGKGI